MDKNRQIISENQSFFKHNDASKAIKTNSEIARNHKCSRLHFIPANRPPTLQNQVRSNPDKRLHCTALCR